MVLHVRGHATLASLRVVAPAEIFDVGSDRPGGAPVSSSSSSVSSDAQDFVGVNHGFLLSLRLNFWRSSSSFPFHDHPSMSSAEERRKNEFFLSASKKHAFPTRTQRPKCSNQESDAKNIRALRDNMGWHNKKKRLAKGHGDKQMRAK